MTSEESLSEIFGLVHYLLKGMGFVSGVLLFQVASTSACRKHLMSFLVAMCVCLGASADGLVVSSTSALSHAVTSGQMGAFTFSAKVQLVGCSAGHQPYVLYRDSVLCVAYNPAVSKFGYYRKVSGVWSAFSAQGSVYTPASMQSVREITLGLTCASDVSSYYLSVDGFHTGTYRTSGPIQGPVFVTVTVARTILSVEQMTVFAGASYVPNQVAPDSYGYKTYGMEFYAGAPNGLLKGANITTGVPAVWYGSGTMTTNEMKGLYWLDDLDTGCASLPSVVNFAPIASRAVVSGLVVGPVVIGGASGVAVHPTVVASRAANSCSSLNAACEGHLEQIFRVSHQLLKGAGFLAGVTLFRCASFAVCRSHLL